MGQLQRHIAHISFPHIKHRAISQMQGDTNSLNNSFHTKNHNVSFKMTYYLLSALSNRAYSLKV